VESFYIVWGSSPQLFARRSQEEHRGGEQDDTALIKEWGDGLPERPEDIIMNNSKLTVDNMVDPWPVEQISTDVNNMEVQDIEMQEDIVKKNSQPTTPNMVVQDIEMQEDIVKKNSQPTIPNMDNISSDVNNITSMGQNVEKEEQNGKVLTLPRKESPKIRKKSYKPKGK